MGRYILVFFMLVTVLISCGQDGSKNKQNNLNSKGHKTGKKVKKEDHGKTDEGKVKQGAGSGELEEGSKEGGVKVGQGKGKSKEKEVDYKINFKEGSQIKVVYDELVSDLKSQRSELEKARGIFTKFKKEQPQFFVDPFKKHIPNVSKEKQEDILDKIHAALIYDVSSIRRVGETFNQLLNCDPAAGRGLIKRIEHVAEWNQEYLNLLSKEILYKLNKKNPEDFRRINENLKAFVEKRAEYIKEIEALARKGKSKGRDNKIVQEELCKEVLSDPNGYSTTKINTTYNVLGRIRREVSEIVRLLR
ncbi:hypothetical protein [Borrelia sp. RT5S]|uniref:hypothetical protein n=1 Tax=Borrelia sp. RT5S TaxID=2898581 RepID=UPI001E56A252|nr:hypothetical protein [Borrelia sp. RT5S]UGQ16774.1 hypothetical protein LSO06_05485 [Borrelia sp. RT5S]